MSTAGEGPAQALVIIDLQSGFVTGPRAVPRAGALVEGLSTLLLRARAAGALVVHVQNDGRAGEVDEPGSPGWDLHLQEQPSPDEVVVRKQRDDAFDGTGLGDLLATRGITRVVFGGVLSEMCVSATARTALDLGLDVVLPRNAHATHDLDDIPASTVARVAEHALGDQPWLPASADAVTFVSPPS
jgi:nicotinamidase-related amidase